MLKIKQQWLIKYLQIDQILALYNPWEADMPLNKYS